MHTHTHTKSFKLLLFAISIIIIIILVFNMFYTLVLNQHQSCTTFNTDKTYLVITQRLPASENLTSNQVCYLLHVYRIDWENSSNGLRHDYDTYDWAWCVSDNQTHVKLSLHGSPNSHCWWIPRSQVIGLFIYAIDINYVLLFSIPLGIAIIMIIATTFITVDEQPRKKETKK